VSNRGKIFQQPQLFLRCSTWKDESKDGYHVEQGRASRPIGGWWLELTSAKTRDHRNSTYHVRMRAVPT
jgi:hypothetical protein